MTTFATAMRAANVADFYMTKYLSKAQEALGPVIQPFIAGMRRIASAESAPEAAGSTLVQRARQRIRRFIFCANRTMWFSACELGVFLATSDSCIKTESTTKVFSGKGIAMMHECKRLLNHSTAAEGLLLAHSNTEHTKMTSMDAFLVQRPTDSDADAASHATGPTDSDATEHAAERNKDDAATEHARGDPSAVITRHLQKNNEDDPVLPTSNNQAMLQSAPFAPKTIATKLFLRLSQASTQPLLLQTPQERSKCLQGA